LIANLSVVMSQMQRHQADAHVNLANKADGKQTTQATLFALKTLHHQRLF